MKCPVCDGKGGFYEDFGEGTILFEPCEFCNEGGCVSVKKWLWDWWFWQNAPYWFFDLIAGEKK